MSENWRLFLQNLGAVWDNGRVAHFGDKQQELTKALGDGVMADLSHFGLISAVGSDVERFLQGQLTSDVHDVTQGRSQLTSWCTNKGRVLASLRIVGNEHLWMLQLPMELLDTVRHGLQRYVFRAQVTLGDASNDWVRVGLAGDRTAELIEKRLGIAPPAQVDDVVHRGSTNIVRLPGIVPSFQVLAPQDEAQGLWNELSGELYPVGAGPWTLLEILAGIPTVYQQTSGAFLPQMLNLQNLNAVSFKKGCYTGQEIVARTQHLGKLKRRMYLGRIRGDTGPPRPGDALVAPEESSEDVGMVVNAGQHPDGDFRLLAVLRIEAAEKWTIRLATGTQSGLELEPLPYPV